MTNETGKENLFPHQKEALDKLSSLNKYSMSAHTGKTTVPPIKNAPEDLATQMDVLGEISAERDKQMAVWGNPSQRGEWTKDQWPNNICSGYILYGRANNYEGFYITDASHGIPTFAAVSEDKDGEKTVRVFNYPGQTEDIARRLVAAWNACVGIPTEQLESLRGYFGKTLDDGK